MNLEINYENNIADSIAFMRYHLATNPDFKRHRVTHLYLYPSLVFTGISIFAILNKEYAGVIAGAVGALAVFFWNWCVYRRYERKLVKQIQSTKQKEFHCLHAVTISSEGITEKTTETQNFHTWNAITRVAFTPEYIYVFSTPITAHSIIPLRELGDTVFQQVVAEIQKYWNA